MTHSPMVKSQTMGSYHDITLNTLAHLLHTTPTTYTHYIHTTYILHTYIHTYILHTYYIYILHLLHIYMNLYGYITFNMMKGLHNLYPNYNCVYFCRPADLQKYTI